MLIFVIPLRAFGGVPAPPPPPPLRGQKNRRTPLCFVHKFGFALVTLGEVAASEMEKLRVPDSWAASEESPVRLLATRCAPWS